MTHVVNMNSTQGSLPLRVFDPNDIGGGGHINKSPVGLGLCRELQRSNNLFDPYLFDLLQTATPNKHEKLILPFMREFIDKDIPITEDAHGNFYCIVGDPEPNIMFSSHMDTVHLKPWKIRLFKTYDVPMDKRDFIFAGRGDKEEGKKKGLVPCNLGGDDKIGVYILSRMINEKIPGLYMFHQGEEIGCQGSRLAAASYATTPYLKKVTRAIAFDRKGYGDVIHTQKGGTTCSSSFANSLAEKLNAKLSPLMGAKAGAAFKYKGEIGVWTDTAEYKNVISECTNLSCGYFQQHGEGEHMDPLWLESVFVPAVLKVDWSSLPVFRDPTPPIYIPPVQNSASTWRSSHHHSSNQGSSFKELDQCDWASYVPFADLKGTGPQMTEWSKVPPLPAFIGDFFDYDDLPSNWMAVDRMLVKSNVLIDNWHGENRLAKWIYKSINTHYNVREELHTLREEVQQAIKDGIKLPQSLVDLVTPAIVADPEPKASEAKPKVPDNPNVALAHMSDVGADVLGYKQNERPQYFRDRLQILQEALDCIEEDIYPASHLKLCDDQQAERATVQAHSAQKELDMLHAATSDLETALCTSSPDAFTCGMLSDEAGGLVKQATDTIQFLSKMMYGEILKDKAARQAVESFLVKQRNGDKQEERQPRVIVLEKAISAELDKMVSEDKPIRQTRNVYNNILNHFARARRLMEIANRPDNKHEAATLIAYTRQSQQEHLSGINLFETMMEQRKGTIPGELLKLSREWYTGYMMPCKTFIEAKNLKEPN